MSLRIRTRAAATFPCALMRAEGAALHLEMPAKELILQEANCASFSKWALKSFNNQTDFDSAIRRFDPSRPSQHLSC